MVDYREILRLNSFKYTQRQIAASVHSSRNTISEVIKLAAENNLCWPLDDQLTNEKVYALLQPDKLEAVNLRCLKGADPIKKLVNNFFLEKMLPVVIGVE